MSLVKNLFYEFDDGFALDVAELELSDGITALWGESGSGKSTILSCLIGLLRPVEMQWDFHGVDLAQLPIGQRRLGVVMQKDGLFDHLNGRQNIEFAARARGWKREQIDQYCEEVSQSLGVKGILRQSVEKMSGGERQRIALARALCGEPRCLLLDEPFSALDLQNRQRARQQLQQIVAELKVPVVLVTHDEGDVEQLADLTYRVKRGRIQ